jgi:2-polyprenyl-3-methyl-5-hydroxy-6-metoxy-1,4-benzoquinol methylase
MSNVQSFYDENVQNEWDRLGVRHRTEFAVTLRALREFLPPAPACIIDIGGGPGRYALSLAEAGYGVTLLDLSESNVAFAQEKALETGIRLEGAFPKNALDLADFSSESFDAALLMGPLYHLWKESDRLQALSEARRLLKPGGVIFASFISRFAAFQDAASKGFAWILEKPELNDKLLTTGINVGATDGFTDAYFAHPDEVIPLCEAAGFETIIRIGVEGMAGGHETYINSLQGRDFEIWADLNYRIGKDPAAIGASEHILYVGRKKE